MTPGRSSSGWQYSNTAFLCFSKLAGCNETRILEKNILATLGNVWKPNFTSIIYEN